MPPGNVGVAKAMDKLRDSVFIVWGQDVCNVINMYKGVTSVKEGIGIMGAIVSLVWLKIVKIVGIRLRIVFNVIKVSL